MQTWMINSEQKDIKASQAMSVLFGKPVFITTTVFYFNDLYLLKLS